MYEDSGYLVCDEMLTGNSYRRFGEACVLDQGDNYLRNDTIRTTYLNRRRTISTYQTKMAVVLDINYCFGLNTKRKVTGLCKFVYFVDRAS